MCCQNFNVEVLFANIYGSLEYKENTGIPIHDFIKDYCRQTQSL
jgi:hypothetical protein